MAGVTSSFERVREQTGNVAGASWSNMSSRHTERTRVNKIPTNCSIELLDGMQGSAASAAAYFSSGSERRCFTIGESRHAT